MTQQQTQTISRGSGPRGWERLVSQLNTAEDLTAFHRGMLDVQCKIVAAEYGALWARAEEGPRPLEAWPKNLAQVPAESPMMKLLAQAAQSGFERGVSHVLKAEPEDPTQAPDLGAHLFVTVLRAKGQVVAVTTVVAECRDAAVLQSTAPMRELAAGLYEGYFARQEASERERDAQRVRQAMAMLAVSQEATGFAGSCLNLVNELARQLKCSRVSLGWVKGHGIRMIAMSDTEHLKRHSEQVTTLELAMAECLDQQQPLVHPVPEDAEPLLQHAVVHAHRRVTGGQPGRNVVSLPLRHRDEWIGVLTLERTDEPFDPGLIQYLQLIADVVAPQLDDRRQSSRPLIFQAGHSFTKTAEYLVGPKHTAWKVGALVLLGVLLFVCFGTWDYRVSAPFVFEDQSRRLVAAPFEAKLVSVSVQPGMPVTAGQELARLDTTDMRLRLAKARSERNRYYEEAIKARGERKWADVKQSEAGVAEAEADIELLEYFISQAVLRAPIDGHLLTGDWHDKIGGKIDQGQQMFEVAPLHQEDLVALIHVSESDIDQLQAAGGQRGELATRSEPQIGFPFEVTRVVPVANPVNGVNAFEVRARLLPPQDESEAHQQAWLRPGMEGLAKIDAGKKRIGWILTHRIADTLRLWFWW